MSTPANSSAGTPLWAHLSIDDARQLIRDDVSELNRLYTLKAIDDGLPPEQRNYLLKIEITTVEAAHDSHFDWLKQIAAREAGKTQQKALG